MNDLWQRMRKLTQARIGLGRSGSGITTRDLLSFQLAHAQARDAVHKPWNFHHLNEKLQELGEPTVLISSQIADRETFLKRPDLGRKLSIQSAKDLQGNFELALIISDGLSAAAIENHFLPFWKILRPLLNNYTRAPLAICPFSRVAIADDVGFAFNAKISVIFIGERPGLSSADSLGVYLTYDPKPGRHDANRNCLSNIRPPEGLAYELAANKLSYLIRESSRLQLSGVNLKEAANSQEMIVEESGRTKSVLPLRDSQPPDEPTLTF
jgi:ethanolamine ammonia-lyase small subunit